MNLHVASCESFGPSIAKNMDTRPLITSGMREENREEWDSLWNLNRPDVCPVCLARPDIWDSPMNSDFSTRCTHWVCIDCWAEISRRDRQCPICRDDLSEWLENYAEESEEEEEEEEVERESD
ncbi:MAG: hypothetical protein ACFHHU_01310 [Porticoccaceae bacterium]